MATLFKKLQGALEATITGAALPGLFFAVSLPAHAGIAWVGSSHTVCVQSSASTAAQTCNLAAPTTAGDDVLVGIAWKNTAANVASVAGSAPNSWFSLHATTCNSANECVATLLCHQCVAQAAVTTTMSAGTPFVTLVEEYSGVAAIGITGVQSATSASPGLTMTTGDANDWMICATASPGTAGIPTASSGNLRDANRTGTASADVAGAMVDNIEALPGSLSCAATTASGAWATTGVELRSVAPRTWIWPDCDAPRPCVVHHIDTVSDGTAYGETLQGFKFPMAPSSPGNLLVFTVTHVSSKTITVIDNNSGAWQTAVTTTNTTDGEETDLLYLCGAAPGTNLINIQLSQPALKDEVLQFSYSEISGIAPSACLDGASGANGLTGAVQPGPITTSVAGDLVYNFGEESYAYPEQEDPIGWVMPDDNSALMMENTYDKFASQISVQTVAGSYIPTLYVNADPNHRNWNSVAAAFKAQSGAGAQPTGIHVTRILHYLNALNDPVSVPFPTGGNAIVLSTSNPSNGDWDMADLSDNLGHTYTRTAFSNARTDPQQYFTCLGFNGGSRDLAINWTPSTENTHLLLYEIAGAKTTGGSIGCAGATVNTVTGEQPTSPNANLTGDPVITPDATGSVVIATSYIGTGPPSASLTPNVVFNSIWADGMIDASSWDTGDPFAYIYTASTSPISFNWQMANSTGLADGGTYFDGAAIEILPGQVVATTSTTTTLTASATLITQGTSVTLTATIAASGSSTTPTGSVNFYNGTTLLGTVPLTNGAAALAINTLPAGADPISATYGGATGFAGSSSSTVTITVTSSSTSNPVPVITGMSPLLVLVGNSRFTLTVTGSQFTSASTVYWGPTALATQFTSATQIAAQAPAADVASAGIYSITVQTPAPGGGTSNTFQFEIDSASASVTAPSFTPSSATVAAGSSATYSVKLPSAATNPSATCLNLPAGVTCSYSATTGGLTVSTSSSTPAGTYRITVVFTETLPVSLSFVLLPFVLLPFRSIRRRRLAGGLWLTSALLLAVIAGAVSGCGGGSSQSTTTSPPPQTHQVTSSGVVTLTVQ